MTPAIRLSGLAKTFGQGASLVEALRGIDLEIEPGQVFGFLGPNGAGKTTTIRLITDLIRPSSGSIWIFGEEVGKNPAVLARLGALVEDADFYDPLTARDNLRVLALTAGLDQADRIEQLLDQLELSAAADRRVSGFSTGMRQRLGIAAALLAEPTGELRIQAEPIGSALEVLRPSWRPTAENNWIQLSAGPDDSPAIVALLVDSGIRVRQVIYRRQSLEDYFMSVTDQDSE